MVVRRLDLAVVVALALALLWVEHDNRIVISTPAAAEAASQVPSSCPDTDDVPFSNECLSFLGVGPQAAVAVPPRAVLSRRLASDARERTAAQRPACPPTNENAPYSASCIRFLSGWYWQPDTGPRTP